MSVPFQSTPSSSSSSPLSAVTSDTPADPVRLSEYESLDLTNGNRRRRWNEIVAAARTLDTNNNTRAASSSSKSTSTSTSHSSTLDDATRSRTRRVSGAVFRYVSDVVKEPSESGADVEQQSALTTGDVLVQLERRLRDENVPVWCVAKHVSPPNVVARNHANEPCDYYVALAVDESGRQALVEASTDGENEHWLASAGFQVRMSHSKKRADYKRLPNDLVRDASLCEVYVDERALHFYDPKMNGDVVRNYARMTARDKPSNRLAGTGVQVVRTSVTPEQWPQTRDALVRQAREHLPICEAVVVNCVRQEVIPVGFHVLGTTHSSIYLGNERQEVVLFDMYSVQMKRYHVELSGDEIAWIERLRSTHAQDVDDSDDGGDVVHAFSNEDEQLRFRTLLAARARTIVDEMDGLTPKNVHRHVKWTLRQSKNENEAANTDDAARARHARHQSAAHAAI